MSKYSPYYHCKTMIEIYEYLQDSLLDIDDLSKKVKYDCFDGNQCPDLISDCIRLVAVTIDSLDKLKLSLSDSRS